MADQESRDEENTRLALALLDDDEGALQEILRLYGSDTIKVLHAKYSARMNVLKYEDIEDVVSIAIHRVWDARKQYDDKKQSLRAWFFCIADNVAKDVLKSGWQQARRLERNPGKDWLEESPVCAAPEPQAETKVEKRRESKRLQDLAAVVKRLPEVQRRILLADAATRDEVASSEVLADELDVPAAHVRVYRSRGLATVRKEMKKLGHDVP